jgi:hypothetical protein
MRFVSSNEAGCRIGFGIVNNLGLFSGHSRRHLPPKAAVPDRAAARLGDPAAVG